MFVIAFLLYSELLVTIRYTVISLWQRLLSCACRKYLGLLIHVRTAFTYTLFKCFINSLCYC